MIQEKKKHKKLKKKPSAMAQVHNRVNAGVMDGVVYGGMMEAAEPEDEEYEIGMEEGGPEPYAHVVNENTDYIPSLHLSCNDFDAVPFICFKKKDGDSTKVFVGARSELHSTMPAALFSNGELNRSDFGNSLWDVKRDEKRSGRLWLPNDYQDYSVISFYSYYDTPTQIYRQCWDVLPTLQHELDDAFSTGKMVVDLWTHAKGRADVLMPLRWFNNGTAEVYLPYAQSCVPEKSSLTDEIVFKLETTKGKFALDWYGDDVADGAGFGLAENKKTMYITEEQMKQIKVLLENEGTNLKKARNFLKARGYDEQERQQLLDGIRHDIPNSRLRDCKFILGVVRLYETGQLSDGRSIMAINQTLKYIAMDAHVNEYDNNLNGEDLDTLVNRFSAAAASNLQQSIQASNARQFTQNQNYTIVPIDTPEEAAKYANYVDWCVTQDDYAYNAYTSDGLGRFYFCLRNDFKTIRRTPGPGCPLDDYGLSMIAVSVNDDGSLNTVTCRWNHDHGGNDNIMSLEELENVLGRNFYQTFIPYTEEELRAKGLTPFKDIPGLLNNGADPNEIFKEVKPFGDIYEVENGGKANFIRNVEGRYELCFDKWFTSAVVTEDDGFEYALVYDGTKYNFLLPDLSYLLDKPVSYAEPFLNGYSKVYEGERDNYVINLLREDGSFVFPKWISPKDEFNFDEVDSDGMLTVVKYFGEVWNGNEEEPCFGKNLMSVNEPGKFVFDEWYANIDKTDWFFLGDERVSGYLVTNMKREGDGTTGIKNVFLKDRTPLFGEYGFPAKRVTLYRHVMFIIHNGESEKIFSTVTGKFTQWFDKVYTEYDQSAPFLPVKVERGGKVNYVDRNGDLLSDKSFDGGYSFSYREFLRTDSPMVVKVYLARRVNFMNENGELLSDKWFVNAGEKWSRDKFWQKDTKRRILVQGDDGEWYKLYEDGELVKFESEGMISSEDYNTIHGYGVYEGKSSGQLNEQKESSVDYGKYIKSLIDFMREQHLRIDPLPEIELNPEEQDGIFVKTGYYSPDERKVVVFTDGRHPKDVLRTVAHEFIHHMQNLQNPDKDWGTGGDLEADRKLRSIEGEAFLLGNIIFREWTEKMKKTKELNESINVKKALKNLKNRRDPDNIENWNRIDEIEAEIVEPDDVDLSSFNIKKHLNPKFWDDGHLDTRIRLKLLDIADDFFNSLDVDWVEPEDIIITGSIANYNWNKKYSDIDLHILVDYEDVDERVDFVREYFTLKKNAWNEKHKNLRIFGFPVEVYVQDANEPHASSGVYSIDKDKWLTEPDLDNLRSGKVNKKHVREMVSTYMNKIDCLIDIYKKHKDDEYEMEKVAKDAAEMFDEIKKMRKDDLGKYGREMCDGNIIFKALRRSDYIGKLLKLRDLTYDKINSL